MLTAFTHLTLIKHISESAVISFEVGTAPIAERSAVTAEFQNSTYFKNTPRRIMGGEQTSLVLKNLQ